MKLSIIDRRKYILDHKNWVEKISSYGIRIFSGYKTDKNGKPGGGGLVIIQAKSYEEAKKIIKTDPMIDNKLVEWKLEKLIPVFGSILK